MTLSEETIRGNAIGQQQEKSVNFFRLFCFANKSDYCLLALGVFSALGTGPCLSLMLILYGDLTNTIVLTTAVHSNNVTSQSSDLKAVVDDTRLFMKNQTNIIDAITVFVYGMTLACIASIVFHIILVTSFNLTARNQVITINY